MREKKRFPSILLLWFGLLWSGVLWSAPATTDINSIGIAFVWIPPGSFQMGVPSGPDAQDSETPQHLVTISKGFYLGKFEVTQAQWVAVMGSNPSQFRDISRPVERVSWDDVQTFIRRLNAQEGLQLYRLPTEAEWEYAARAGTETAFYWGDDASLVAEYAWYDANSEKQTHPVGQKRPNGWGLYDMAGNVWEWVQDWYGEQYYKTAPTVDPPGPRTGTSRVVRGGGWHRFVGSMRPTSRDFNRQGGHAPDQGFRLLREIR